MLSKRNAFTLIELLIVVAIIGILAAIAVPNFLNAQIRARIAAAGADMRNLGTALESYRLDNNTYPPGDGGALGRVERLSKLTSPIAYMASVPEDKFNRMTIENANEPFNTYPFWSPGFADGYRTPTGLGRHFGNHHARPNKQWALMSFGPDGDFEAAGGGDLAPFMTSNGLTSNGDIMRFGP